MDDEPDIPEPDDDPELAALLQFEPVPRKQERASGWWSPENQRTFIRMLVETGDYRQAADAVGLTANGAYQLRKDSGAEDFCRAWQEAVALHRRRHGNGGRGLPRHSRELRDARARQRDRPALEEAEREALLDEVFQRYLVKIEAERTARLDGRIVEADFYVRQLAAIELILDIGGRTAELLEKYRLGGLALPQIAATPGSALLEKCRRAFWLEKGEADRPPPAPLGWHNGRFATGRDDYDPERDGDFAAWERRQAENRRIAAETQAAWEERARAGANDNDEADPAS